jgi:hypothetical protein
MIEFQFNILRAIMKCGFHIACISTCPNDLDRTHTHAPASSALRVRGRTEWAMTWVLVSRRPFAVRTGRVSATKDVRIVSVKL